MSLLGSKSLTGGQLVTNFNNVSSEFFQTCRLLWRFVNVKEIDEIVSSLSQCEKPEVLDEMLLKAAVILDDGFLSWQVFVALQNQPLHSPGFSPPRPAVNHN